MAERRIVVIARDLKGKVRTDGGSAEGNERSDMVRCPGLAGMDHNRCLEPDTVDVQDADNRSEGDQTGDRRTFNGCVRIAEDDDAGPAFRRLQDGGGKGVHRRLEPCDPVAPRKEHREHFWDNVGFGWALRRQSLEEAHLSQAQYGTGQLHRLTQRHEILRKENVRPAPEENPQVGDVLLPDVVKGRVCHLGEVLVKIIEERPWLGRKDIRPGGIAHRPDRFLSRRDHGVEDTVDLLFRAGEEVLAENAHGRTGVLRGHRADRDGAGIELRIAVFPRETRVAEMHPPVRQIHFHAGPRM